MNNIDIYLASTQFIDWKTTAVQQRAKTITHGAQNEHEIIDRCFRFVRDEIKHSLDFALNPVTCKASDVLLHGTGFCYAKSHLLAALLRANNIATGLCYQRLSVDPEKHTFCLHGLNAVYLSSTPNNEDKHIKSSWYRLDPRGNKTGISAKFNPPIEYLAYQPSIPGEADFPEIWAEPLAQVTQVLTTETSYLGIMESLPDIEVIQP